MKIKPLRMIAAALLVVVAGCGGGDDRPPDIIQTQIFSDSGYDGDIEQTGPDSAVVTQGMGPTVQNVFAGIDPIAVGEIQQLVRHLTQRGLGVLITDHNVRETLSLVDRAYVIADGQVLTQGSPAEIVNNEDVRRVYLGDMFS